MRLVESLDQMAMAWCLFVWIFDKKMTFFCPLQCVVKTLSHIKSVD